jgi:hypothetical protein
LRVAARDREIERLQLENSKLNTECGHREADLREARSEIARLRQLCSPVWQSDKEAAFWNRLDDRVSEGGGDE